MSLFVPFTRATKLLQPFFEETLKNLPQVSFMVSDGFLWWTSESAAKFKIPRLVFYDMNSYSAAVSISVFKLFTEPETKSDTEPVTVPDFPWIRVNKSDFDHGTTDPKESGAAFELSMDQIMSSNTSHGFLVNSFYELESTFVDYNKPKSWCVGPLCLTDPPKTLGGNNNGNGRVKPGFFPELRRTKSLPASKNSEGFSGVFEPQRRSWDL
ncbi:unnamed protein product [Arabidopsis arenosa]|uniref:Uncharacterized protein n=1 Tax=Arabidopsis arenosa TaxID=38785 RepID=A0A8S2AZJ5_ARAAE|nr:unnamed protein product [Arabidopsis arenosa]